jgi:hypothetical protein
VKKASGWRTRKRATPRHPEEDQKQVFSIAVQSASVMLSVLAQALQPGTVSEVAQIGWVDQS